MTSGVFDNPRERSARVYHGNDNLHIHMAGDVPHDRTLFIGRRMWTSGHGETLFQQPLHVSDSC